MQVWCFIDRYSLKPRARIHHLSVRGDDPIWMLTAPIRATRHALGKTALHVYARKSLAKYVDEENLFDTFKKGLAS